MNFVDVAVSDSFAGQIAGLNKSRTILCAEPSVIFEHEREVAGGANAATRRQKRAGWVLDNQHWDCGT